MSLLTADILFDGPGEMRARCRDVDWAATPLGPVAQWPAALRTVVRTALESPFPTSVWCGAALTLVYNDAYRSVLGVKHPRALGRPGAEVWAEVWDELGPDFAAVAAGGPPVQADDAPFVIERAEGEPGQPAWFTYGLTAVRDDTGAAVAVLNVAVETTARVEASRRLAATLGSISDAFFTLDRAWCFTYVNDRAEQVLFRRREELLGRNVWEEFAPAVGSAFEVMYRRAIATDEAVTFEAFYPPLQTWFEVRAYPGPEGLAVYFQDVTRRHDADAALAESERRFRTVQDASPDASLLLRAVQDASGAVVDFTIVYANAAVQRILLGRDADAPEPLVGRTVCDVFPESVAAGRLDVYRRVAETGEPWLQDVQYTRGAVEHGLRVTAIRVDDGVHVSAADLTERLRAEAERARLLAAAEAAAERAERLRALAVALADAVTEREVGERVMHEGVAAFGAYAGVVGVPMPGGTSVEITHSLGYPPGNKMALGERWPLTHLSPLTEAIRTGAPVFLSSRDAWRARYAAEHASGRAVDGLTPDVGLPPAGSRSAAWAVLPLITEGRVQGAVLWAFTEPRAFDPAEREVLAALAAQCAQALERARLYAAEAAARRIAEEANRAKSDFLATMSHELRTPLNAIQGYVQLLEMELHGPVTPAQRTALARVQQSQRHLLGLIDAVLNFAKLEAGRVEYQITDVSVADAVADVTPLIEPQLAARHLACEIAVPAALAARADRDKLAQILLNLLSNAAKFTPEDGRVAIVAAADGPGAVRLDVRDTGIGIPPERLASVFEPFVQIAAGASPYTRTSQGTGLGLAISRELARGMGGDLSAESTPGMGSTFTLRLPAAVA
ncbi:MAG TPA: ATP-binding protein [Gemmatirosa sp.]